MGGWGGCPLPLLLAAECLRKTGEAVYPGPSKYNLIKLYSDIRKLEIQIRGFFWDILCSSKSGVISSLLSVEAYKNDKLRRPERDRQRPSNTALKFVLLLVPERTMAVSNLLCVYGFYLGMLFLS